MSVRLIACAATWSMLTSEDPHDPDPTRCDPEHDPGELPGRSRSEALCAFRERDRNRFGSAARARPADPEFYPLIERLKRLQASGAIGLRVQKTNEKDATLMTIRGMVDETVAEDSLATRKMLGLDPRAQDFTIAYASLAKNDRELAILSRSILDIIVDLASYIEVPDIHVEENRVNSTQADTSGTGGPLTPLIRIHSSPEKPADAFVAVPYHGYWFWIDDRDLPSKRMFSFLIFIFTLVEKTNGKESAPIVTIPAG
ncbi:MAG: hypothetical protein AB9866_07235 [Syntrophobacteraceae bacterium]